MPSNNSENFLERLNYYNGQRLDAEGLRVEQEYHIEMRRRLNQALYTHGIASGLEIRPDPDNTHQVIVSPGVALDVNGREVILLEETKVPVHGLPNSNSAWTFGNYLYIEYAEQQVATSNDGCNLASNKNDLAWGGPTRIRAIPKLAFADSWPNELKGPIILAQVELDSSCAVAQIHNAPRKYVDAAKSATRAVSYEGEKDIDKNNSKTLTFHIEGGPAKSVILYLWGEKFSSLFYTELGAHEHNIPEIDTAEQISDTAEVLDHTHTVDIKDLAVTEEGSIHGSKHDIKFPANDPSEKDISDDYAINVGTTADEFKWLSELNYNNKLGLVNGGEHSHELLLPSGGLVLTTPPDTTMSSGSHHHRTEESTTKKTGQGRLPKEDRTKRLTYVDNLQVILDGTDNITDLILSQLRWDWLGDGTSAHEMATIGSNAIALHRISTFNQGVHTLEFRCPTKKENNNVEVTDWGGNIRYNLYVE